MPRVVFYFNDQMRERMVYNAGQFKNELSKFENEVCGKEYLPKDVVMFRLFEIRKKIDKLEQLIFEESFRRRLECSTNPVMKEEGSVVFVHLCYMPADRANLQLTIAGSNLGAVENPTLTTSQIVIPDYFGEQVISSEQNSIPVEPPIFQPPHHAENNSRTTPYMKHDKNE